MPRFLSFDEVAQIGLEIATAQSRRLARRFALTPDEQEELLSYFLEVLAGRLLPRSRRATCPRDVRATMWRYFDAGQGGGRPSGAGWHAATLLKRRAAKLARERPLDDGGAAVEVPDHRGCTWDALMRADDLRWEIARDAVDRHEREVARSALARYLRHAPRTDRVVLQGKADGLTFREIAAREHGREPTRTEVNTMVQRYRRAWARLSPSLARVLRPLCPPPGRDARKGRRRPAAADG